MNRIHLKRNKRRKIKKTNIIFTSIIFAGILTLLLIYIISNSITPIIMETAELEINKFSMIIINKAISQVLDDKISEEDMFITTKSNDGKIQAIDFNPIIVNQVLNIATTVVQNNLKLLEEGNLDNIGIYDIDLPEERIEKLKKGIITEIPLGIIFKNTILSNIGPKIPIRLHYVGDVNSNITTKVTQYGINNALVEISVKLEMTAQIVLPFITKKTVIESSIPLSIKMIQGTVPNYYGGSIEKNSMLYSLPFE